METRDFSELIMYPVDWDKVETVDDVKEVLKCLGLHISSNSKYMDTMRKYLKLN